MSERDIQANMEVIRDIAGKVVGADLAEGEREAVRGLVLASLALMERALLDLNKIAQALEVIAMENRRG